jgi:hypothetical protein
MAKHSNAIAQTPAATHAPAAAVPVANDEVAVAAAEPASPDDDQATDEQAARGDATPASEPAKEVGLPDDPIQAAIVQARAYSKQGRDVAALGVYRKLGQRFPENPTILEGWSTSAAETQGWGEALRVAMRWAAIDDSASAQLHLARTQRRVGQRTGAISTLQRLLQVEPNNAQATALLAKFGS